MTLILSWKWHILVIPTIVKETSITDTVRGHFVDGFMSQWSWSFSHCTYGKNTLLHINQCASGVKTSHCNMRTGKMTTVVATWPQQQSFHWLRQWCQSLWHLWERPKCVTFSSKAPSFRSKNSTNGPFKWHKVGLCVVCVTTKCVVDTIIQLH
jgi:hypothetical protein